MDKKHTFKDWMVAVRPWSFPASTMPVAVTLAYLFWRGAEINWLYGVWALLGIIFFHACGNTWSDWFDYKHKVDGEDTFGAKTLTSGQFTPHEILWLSIGLLVVAVASGLGLMLCTGTTLLWIGLGGAACTLFYPQLKFNALGDLDILICYALLPTFGTSFVATGAIDWSVLWLALPIGLITVAILHSNNTRDMQTDRRAGITTFALEIGRKASVAAYGFEVLFPFAWTAGCVLGGIFPWWSLAVLPALLPAIGNTRQMVRFLKGGMAEIGFLDQKTAQLQLLFSLLLAASFALAALL